MSSQHKQKNYKLFCNAAALILCLLLAACNDEAENPANTSATFLDSSATGEQRFSEPNRHLTNNFRQLLLLYLQQIEKNFENVTSDLQLLQTEIQTFLNSPGSESIDHLRTTWINSYDRYELSTLDRYFMVQVLDEQSALDLFQLQYQINHWPLIPGYIDYVENYADSGIVSDINVPLDAQNLREQHGLFDLSEIVLGYHAIEFLIWGTNSEGMPTQRISDYQVSSNSVSTDREIEQLPNSRRRVLLKQLSNILLEDFQSLQELFSDSIPPLRQEIKSIPAGRLLAVLSGAMAEMLRKEILLKSLYPMLNGDFTESIPSPYSYSSQNVVSNQLSGLERVLRENVTEDGLTLDTLFMELSDNFADFFYENFDASKECLVVLYSTLQLPQPSINRRQSEFKIVECINRVSNMIDYLQQLENSSNAPA